MTSILRALAAWPLYLLVLVTIAVWLWDRRARITLALGVGGAVLALIINHLLQLAYVRPRPFVSLHFTPLIHHAKDASFYSDHTCVAGALVAGLLVANRRIGLAAVVAALAVAFARVAAGVHYPSDVVAGLLVGGACTFLLLRARPQAERVTARAGSSLRARRTG